MESTKMLKKRRVSEKDENDKNEENDRSNESNDNELSQEIFGTPPRSPLSKSLSKSERKSIIKKEDLEKLEERTQSNHLQPRYYKISLIYSCFTVEDRIIRTHMETITFVSIINDCKEKTNYTIEELEKTSVCVKNISKRDIEELLPDIPKEMNIFIDYGNDIVITVRSIGER